MSGIDTLSWDDTASMMAENINAKINRFNDDQMYLLCGYEGGKATSKLPLVTWKRTVLDNSCKDKCFEKNGEKI